MNAESGQFAHLPHGEIFRFSIFLRALAYIAIFVYTRMGNHRFIDG